MYKTKCHRKQCFCYLPSVTRLYQKTICSQLVPFSACNFPASPTSHCHTSVPASLQKGREDPLVQSRRGLTRGCRVSASSQDASRCSLHGCIVQPPPEASLHDRGGDQRFPCTQTWLLRHLEGSPSQDALGGERSKGSKGKGRGQPPDIMYKI